MIENFVCEKMVVEVSRCDERVSSLIYITNERSCIWNSFGSLNHETLENRKKIEEKGKELE